MMQIQFFHMSSKIVNGTCRDTVVFLVQAIKLPKKYSILRF